MVACKEGKERARDGKEVSYDLSGMVEVVVIPVLLGNSWELSPAETSPIEIGSVTFEELSILPIPLACKNVLSCEIVENKPETGIELLIAQEEEGVIPVLLETSNELGPAEREPSGDASTSSGLSASLMSM